MNKKISLIILLFAMLACVLPGAPQPVNIPQQPADLNSLQTIIVQTADAAQTQTASAIPTSTYTATPTRTPSATPTSTVTFVFLFPTFTLIPTQTPIGQISGGGSGGGTPEKSIYKDQPWACRVTATEPPRWAVIPKGITFYAYWTILNTGTKTWTINTIDLVYTGGYRHEGSKIQDIKQSTSTGGTIRVGAKFTAPKAPGEYQSFFTLQVGNRPFCGMKILFVINE